MRRAPRSRGPRRRPPGARAARGRRSGSRGRRRPRTPLSATCGRGQHLDAGGATAWAGRRGFGGSPACSRAARRPRSAISPASKRRKKGEGAGEAAPAETAVGDQYLLDRWACGRSAGRRPAVPGAEGGIGDRRGAAVEARRELDLERLGIDQGDLEAASVQGERQHRAVHAGAGDDDVIGGGRGHHRRLMPARLAASPGPPWGEDAVRPSTQRFALAQDDEGLGLQEARHAEPGASAPVSKHAGLRPSYSSVSASSSSGSAADCRAGPSSTIPLRASSRALFSAAFFTRASSSS